MSGQFMSLGGGDKRMDLIKLLASMQLDRQPFWRLARRHARRGITAAGRLNGNRYSPHQGEREKARRLRQAARNGGGKSTTD